MNASHRRLGARHRARVAFALVLVLTLVGSSAALPQERGDDTKRRSRNGIATGHLDGQDTEIMVTYGRPTVRERRIWNQLVPWGKVWRAGADEATTITFSTDVRVEGERLPAGTYSLFVLPFEESWTFIFNRVANQWGAYEYDEEKDALRIEVEPQKAEHCEELTYTVEDNRVILHWSNLRAAFTVTH